MKRHTISIFVAVFGVAFAVGLWSGCTVDFDVGDDPTVFSCETDEDCVDPYVCNQQAGHCDVPDDDDDNDNQNNGETIDECDPEELGDDYPLDEPLDIPEQCDGQDTNCDGNIDDMSCETDADCPDSGQDVYGTELQYTCNTELEDPQCETFYPPNEFACSGPYACDSERGAHESVYEDCGEGNPPPENQDDGNGDNNDSGDGDDNGDGGEEDNQEQNPDD